MNSPKFPVIQSLGGAALGMMLKGQKLIPLKKELGNSLDKFIAAVDELEWVIRNEQ